jgi:hypothetical protein
MPEAQVVQSSSFTLGVFEISNLKVELAIPEKYSKAVRVSGRMIIAQRFIAGERRELGLSP